MYQLLKGKEVFFVEITSQWMSELLSFMFSIAFFRLLTPPPLNIT